jgi:hypothetical protein
MKIVDYLLRLVFLTFLLVSTEFCITQAADAQSVQLSQYPLLSQKDPANYRDPSLLTVQDSLPSGVGKATVPDLACAATVYVMLERGRGNPQAMIDDFYPDPRKFNGNSPGAKRPAYVGSDVSIDPQQVIALLKSGQPVVLHGFGGPLKEHFVLAVGFNTDADGKEILTALDPYSGKDSDKPGKQIEISIGAGLLVHPIYSDIVFQKMRSVTGESSSSSSTTTTDNYTITMKDGTVVVGAIQIRKVKFSASYGAVEVNLNDVMTFNDGFLTLNDGSKLKGSFSSGNLTLKTTRDEMNLPFESITSITKPSTVASMPPVAPPSATSTVIEKPTSTGDTSLREDSAKLQGLRIGMEYDWNKESGSPVGGGYVYGSTVYIFGSQGVSVYKVIGNEGNIFLDRKQRTYITSNGLGLQGGHPKGTRVGRDLVVIFGPGDRVPVLENAPYKVEGTSIYVDWSQSHGTFFPLSFSSSNSEVFTIKNDGLVLESSTSPGFNLTLNINAIR